MDKELRYSVPFTPLEERLAREAPHLLPGLAALRAEMGDTDFDTYINSLASLKQSQDQLLLFTRRAMFRSILLSRFLPAIQKCFGAKYVQIITQ